VRKLAWLVPMIVVAALLGTLLLLTKGTTIMSFHYSKF
jgi:hypothetical protein